MNYLIHNTVGIRFKPEDNGIGIPMNMLEMIEKKTMAESLNDKEMASVLEENNLNEKDIAGIREALINRLRQKNGCMIEYTFKYSDGWYRLEKYNCELNQHEIDYLKEFIEMTCNPIILEIQELK